VHARPIVGSPAGPSRPAPGGSGPGIGNDLDRGFRLATLNVDVAPLRLLPAPDPGRHASRRPVPVTDTAPPGRRRLPLALAGIVAVLASAGTAAVLVGGPGSAADNPPGPSPVSTTVGGQPARSATSTTGTTAVVGAGAGAPTQATDPYPTTTSIPIRAHSTTGTTGTTGPATVTGTSTPPTETPLFPPTLPAVPGALLAFYQTPDPLSPAPPGSIIRSQQIAVPAGLPARTTAFRILYHSESDTGSDIPESGIVVIPGRPPPAGGYRIVTWAHGTTGLADACAPSMDGVDPIPYLSQLLTDGYVVAATDYQGLGTAGVHPYLVGQSEGQSVLDAARAARDLLGPVASDEVVVFGHSQGGQAALFAGQIAGAYAPELFIAGVVSVAPVSDVSEFVPPQVGRSADPLAVYTVASLYAWSETYGDLPLGDVLTPHGLAMTAAIDRTCINALADEFARQPTDRIFRARWEQDAAVVAHEAQNEPGGAPTAAPILMVQGVSDILVPFRLTTATVDQRLCRDQHDTVQYDAYRNAGHSNVVQAAQNDTLRWITARFGGRRPAPSSCGGPVRTHAG